MTLKQICIWLPDRCIVC